MNVQIINKDLTLDMHGLSGIAINKDYPGTAFKLMDKMWQTVKANKLQNKGLNIWVYETNEKVFATAGHSVFRHALLLQIHMLAAGFAMSCCL